MTENTKHYIESLKGNSESTSYQGEGVVSLSSYKKGAHAGVIFHFDLPEGYTIQKKSNFTAMVPDGFSFIESDVKLFIYPPVDRALGTWEGVGCYGPATKEEPCWPRGSWIAVGIYTVDYKTKHFGEKGLVEASTVVNPPNKGQTGGFELIITPTDGGATCYIKCPGVKIVD